MHLHKSNKTFLKKRYNMKNYKVSFRHTTTILTTIVLAVSILSCRKDWLNESSNLNDRLNSSLRSGEVIEGDFNFYPFDIPSGTLMSVEEGRKALAYAVSSEMFHNIAFRDTIYSIFCPDSVRYKEVVFGSVRNRTIPTLEGGSTVTKTISTLLNERLRQLSIFSAVPDPLEHILENDELVSLWFPNHLIHTFRDSLFDNYLPIIYSNLIFVEGWASELEEESVNKVVGLRISEAPMYRLYDPVNKRYHPGNVAFEDMHGYTPDICQELSQHLDNLPYYELSPNFKLVHVVDDVQKFYANECSSSPPIPLSSQLNNYSCPRAEYELKIIGDYNKNANYFNAFELASPAAFDHISSHPCNQWYSNKTMAFRFTWLPAVDGEPIDQPYHHLVHCYSTDLMATTYSYIRVTPPRLPFPFYFPVIKTVISKNIKTYWFPEGPRVVFSNDEAKNHWKLDKNGDGVFFSAKIVHFGSCTGSNQQTTTHSFQIGGKFDFKIPKIELPVGINFEYKYSRQKVVTYQITASDTYDLGNANLEYCHPYVPGSGNRFLQWISTGTVILRFRSPWYN